ncbi:hypothetical protein [Streptomyces paludis]|uniref:hypothetical protein n=1 Tax=Streptomyces paludis TaxID=2282738 RepID=UPI0013B3A3D9|nr:hypothetical protein [Streptomyces paludis]
MHTLARALADQLHPGAAPRDVTVSFGARRQAPVEYRARSRGGPVTVFAQALHATLYGLPTDNKTLPAALDALLQTAHTATAPEQQTALLRQVAEQLRNAAEIIQRYQYRAQWNRYPDDIAKQLHDAHGQAQQIAQTLDRVASAFSNPPGVDTAPNAYRHHGPSTAAPAPPLTPTTGRHR